MIDIRVLREIPLFADLTDDQLGAVAARGEERAVANGETVFEQHSDDDELFVLLEGRVQISIEMNRPTEQAPVHTVTEGKVFGEFALLAGMKRSATARTVKDSRFFVLNRASFEALAEQDPLLGYRMLRQLTGVLVGRIVKTTQELRSSLLF